MVLEQVASMAFHTKILMGKLSTPKNADRLYKFHYNRKHGNEKSPRHHWGSDSRRVLLGADGNSPEEMEASLGRTRLEKRRQEKR